MKVFGEYAKYYDLLYRDKDYVAEAGYVDDLIRTHAPGAKSVLNLGCGTGNHDIILAEKGYRITGIDRSAESIQKAREKLSGATGPVGLKFETARIQSLKLDKKFDAVISLFHVFSYLTTEEDLLAALETAGNHLRNGGILIFDCWYGPAVLTDQPSVRVKRVENDTLNVIRIAEPELFAQENIVEVNYQVIIGNKLNGKMARVNECHRMRYWFRPEIDRMLADSGFEPINCVEWMSNRKPGTDTWNVCFLARKRDGGKGPIRKIR